MIDIQFPNHPFKIRQQNGKDYIFDAWRKQWLTLTPEEWVRQNFLQYLVMVKNYPASLIAVEKELMLGDLKKRFDIVVYNESRPWMLIECKEMEAALNEAVIKQILNYNIGLHVSYLVVTNGKKTFAARLIGKVHQWLTALPAYGEF